MIEQIQQTAVLFFMISIAVVLLTKDINAEDVPFYLKASTIVTIATTVLTIIITTLITIWQ